VLAIIFPWVYVMEVPTIQIQLSSIVGSRLERHKRSSLAQNCEIRIDHSLLLSGKPFEKNLGLDKSLRLW
jgi:hypothetical protein